MINPLYYLFALLILMLYPTGAEPLFFLEPGNGVRTVGPFSVPTIPFTILILTLLYAGTAFLLLRRASRQSSFGASLRLLRASRSLRIAALLIFGVETYFLHWPTFVEFNLGIRDLPLLPALAGLLPLLILASIHAACALAAAARIGRIDRFREGMRFHFQGFVAMGLCPIVLIILLNDCLARSESLQRLVFIHPFVGWLIGIAFIVGFLLFAPLLLKTLLGAKPLPEGPLRDRLTTLCRTAGLSCGGFFVWNTRGTRIGNAFITGLGGRWRYIFFTDHLLESLPPDEIAAVAGHEIAHATRRHVLLYLILAVAYSTFLTVLYEQWLATTGDPLLYSVILFAFAVAFWVLFFGYASRRFEMEADVEGARLIGDAGLFLRALRNVAMINGLPMDVRSLQHFSIARRTALLAGAEEDPAVADEIRRTALRLKMGLVAFFAISLICQGYSIAEQWPAAGTREEEYAAVESAQEGLHALRREEWTTADTLLSDAAARGALDGRGYVALARIRLKSRDADAAAEYYRRALAVPVTDPRLRLEAETFLRWKNDTEL